MVRWSRACASLLVVVGLLTSTWATCLEGATSTPTQQMACCKAGHHHCPMKNSASDCCKKSGPQLQSNAIVTKAASLTAPVPVPMVWVILSAFACSAPSQHRVTYDASPPGLLYTPPAYIAFSALLI
jgi:hypothetical protein